MLRLTLAAVLTLSIPAGLFAQEGPQRGTIKEEVLERVLQTDSLDARAANAEICQETLKLSFPAVLDREDNAVNEAYSGWPDRFVIVGTDGKIVYYGPPGPGGFKPNEVAEWLTENTN